MRYTICDVFLIYFFLSFFPLSNAGNGKEKDGNKEKEIMGKNFVLMIISCQITVIENLNHKTRFCMTHVRSFALDIEIEHYEIMYQSHFLIAAGALKIEI